VFLLSEDSVWSFLSLSCGKYNITLVSAVAIQFRSSQVKSFPSSQVKLSWPSEIWRPQDKLAVNINRRIFDGITDHKNKQLTPWARRR
jgi:hypothetical protein